MTLIDIDVCDLDGDNDDDNIAKSVVMAKLAKQS